MGVIGPNEPFRVDDYISWQDSESERPYWRGNPSMNVQIDVREWQGRLFLA